MPYDNNPLLNVIDLVSPYLPARLTDPLYSLASLDLASLASNPAQLLPLALSLLAGYTAILSFLSTARFAFRTALSLAKWGSIAAVISAVYLGYTGAGTERGVSGGVQDAAGYATGVGKTLYSLGRHGANYWFASSANNAAGAGSSWFSSSASTTARNRQARERRRRDSKSRAGSASYRSSGSGSARADDPAAGAQAAQDFVGQAFNSVLECLNPPAAGSGSQQSRNSRGAKRAPAQPAAGGDGLSGFAWNLAMGRAKKAWDEMTGGDGTAAEARSGGRSRNR
ncbi:hypothetical protein JCM10908_004972 [Rhodotorula pacifica]|uniref:uncharacterized protein n=1 Tax=Rhodotorula pacifica TaxID=1495444 RepID=UPI00316F3AC5